MTQSRKKVLIISAFFYPHIGGLEGYNLNVATEFIKQNYDVTVITNNTEHVATKEVYKGINIYRLDSYVLKFSNSGGLPFPLLNNSVFKILKELKQSQFDLIISNTRFFVINHLILYYLNINKRHCIHLEHGSGNVDLHNPITNFFSNFYDLILIQLLKHKINSFYGVSSLCNKFLSKYNIVPQDILKAGVEFHTEPINKPLLDVVEITFVGRIIYDKGVSYLLDAFSQIENDNLRLNVVGDGPMLEELIYKYQGNSRIIFHKSQTQSGVKKILKNTHIFINPSFANEGGQMTILEAVAAKCAIISTKVGFTQEIIEDGYNGLFINKQDSNDIIEKINFLLRNSDKINIYGENIFTKLSQDFQWQNTIDKIKQYMIDNKI
ncbi:MAG TPA: glycosyltransferase family 4 protein [Candidatus Kapabacteria bacterium]|nr:glycosyltransferase family 4 protein [Candidatus Kapabacteria bacterium]